MPVLGMRTTTNLTDSTERPKAWRLGIMDEYPDAAPLTHLIYRVGKEKVSDPEFNWFERRFATRELTPDAGDLPGAGVLAGAADTARFGSGEAYNVRAGSILLNTTTMERVIVTADPVDSQNVSIIRGVGASGAQSAWLITHAVQVIGNAQAEGADVGSAITTDPAKKYNYCQIFRNVADVTKTLAATTLRTGDKQKDAQKQALLFHEIDKEWAFMFGIPSEDLTAAPGPRRTTAGLYNYISTNSTDFVAGLTLSGWNTMLKNLFQYGSDEKLLLCGASTIMALENMARAYSYQWADVGKQDSFGMTMRKWITSFGTLMVKEHKLLSRSTKFSSWGFIIDPDNLVYRFVGGRDTDWYPEVQNPGQDRVIGEYLAECGLECHNEYTFGLVKNCSAFVG